MYVKTTDNIWSEIRSKINSLFAKREERANDLYGYGMSREEIDAIVLEKVFPADKQTHIDALGSAYFNEYEQLYVKLSFGTNYTTHQVKFTTPRLMPQRWASSYDTPLIIADDRIAQVLIKRHERVLAIKTEQNKLIEETRKAYYSVSSINQLVKAWPAIQELLPAEVIERLNRKVERSKPDAVTLDNVQSMSASLLMAKVAA